jgi:hypothetical protein
VALGIPVSDTQLGVGEAVQVRAVFARVTAHRLGQFDDGNAVLPPPLVQAAFGVEQIPDTQLTACGFADRFVGMDLHIAADRRHDEAGLMPGRFAGRFGQQPLRQFPGVPPRGVVRFGQRNQVNAGTGAGRGRGGSLTPRIAQAV